MLTIQDIDFYNVNGYLLLPDRFTDYETNVLLSEAKRLGSLDIPQRILENDGVNVRSVYAAHEISDVFGAFVRDVRNIDPARTLLEDEVYIHQTQLNPKTPFKGDLWEWHQDYMYWLRDDGMPKPEALNIAVFLDEVTEFNGPLFVMPGSHTLTMSQETQTMQDGWENTSPLTFDIKLHQSRCAHQRTDLGCDH